MRASPRQISRALVGLAALAAALGAAGCSKPTGSVSGKVYYKGTPLKGGHVIFLTANGQPRWEEIGEDGSYSFDNFPAGPVKVGVETSSLKPIMAGPGRPARRDNPMPKDAPIQSKKPVDPNELAKRYVKIPDKYEKPEDSGKEYTVTAGKQEYKIELD